MSAKEKRYRIATLTDARTWVWRQLLRRTGKASAESLRKVWYWDPSLLDDALSSLRDDGFIACVSGTWYVRDGGPTSAARLPESTKSQP